MKKDQRGIAHVLVLVAAVGLVAFTLISSSANFKSGLFAGLFPKGFSFASSGDGLNASYYNNTSLSGAPVKQNVVTNVNFDWVGGSPDAVVSVNNFSARWTGFIKTPSGSGDYTFYTKSDDGIRVVVNGNQIIDRWVTQNAYNEFSGTINLSGDTVYPITVEYYDGWGNASAQLRWSGPGLVKDLVPQANLYTVDPGSSPAPSGQPSPSPSVMSNNIMWGSWVGSGVNIFGKQGDFEKTVGQKIKVRHIYYSNVSNESLTPQYPDVQTDPAKFAQYLQAEPLRPGEILLLSWATDDVTHPETKDIDKVADGTADLYIDPFIDQWASVLASQSNEIWLNPYWEVNACFGWNNWWCTPQQGAVPFKTAYQRVVNKFRAEFAERGKTNVKYVWNVVSGGNIAASYPGDAHVDISSIDGYPAKQSVLQPIYNNVKAAAPSKPVVIQETSQKYSSGNDLTDMPAFFNNLPAWAPDLLALVWFDEPGGPVWESIIGKPVSYRQAFCDALANNGYQTLGVPSDSTCAGPSPTPSPIPSSTPQPSASASPSPTPPPGGAGLTGFYFSDKNLTNQVLTKVDPMINFQWGSGKADQSLPGADNFSVRWTGQVSAPTTGSYTFYTKSDDGIRLWVNNNLIIDRWDAHNKYSEQISTPITLTAGNNPIKIEYYDGWGEAVIEMRWSGPGITKNLVPSVNLVP